MTLNGFAAKVHGNAVAHGWWETYRPIDEIIALIHSEWSEALEEYRAGRPLLYYPCNAGGICCEEDGSAHCGSRSYDPENPNASCSAQSKKPEGIAVELMDGVIGILDFLVHENAPMEWANEKMNDIKLDYIPEWKDTSFSNFIAHLHGCTTNAWEYMNDDDICEENRYWMYSLLSECVLNVFYQLKKQGLDPEEIALKKHEYNKSRPYRHGSKKC